MSDVVTHMCAEAAAESYCAVRRADIGISLMLARVTGGEVGTGSAALWL